MTYINTKGFRVEEKKRDTSRQMAEIIEDLYYPKFLEWCMKNNVSDKERDTGIRQLRNTADFHRKIANHESL